MLFNTIDFAIFLPIVFLVYWLLLGNRLQLQNIFLVVASYFFYAWWDWRFLFLIIASTLANFSIGFYISRQPQKARKKLLLWCAIVFNIGLLGFFKYFNFFIEAFVDGFSLLGLQLKATSLHIILPIGISFYTFQALSYVIDVYSNRIKATGNLIAFSGFVSFFPQLVAGPIERAQNLLPQFFVRRSFDYSAAMDGPAPDNLGPY